MHGTGENEARCPRILQQPQNVANSCLECLSILLKANMQASHKRVQQADHINIAPTTSLLHPLADIPCSIGACKSTFCIVEHPLIDSVLS